MKEKEKSCNLDVEIYYNAKGESIEKLITPIINSIIEKLTSDGLQK